MPARARNLVAFAAAWLAVLFLLGVSLDGRPWPFVTDAADVHAYWSAWQGGGLYAATPALDVADYIYPPPLAQLIYPLTLLPFPAFAAIWLGASWSAIAWMLAPVRVVWRVPLFLIFALTAGNAAVFVGLAIAVRLPAAWAFPLLTKLTSGVGILWYAVRREWRSLAVALGATALIAGLSFGLAPDLWVRWVASMLGDAKHAGGIVSWPLPFVALPLRLVGAATLVAWGAWTERRWVLAPAALLATPDLLLSSFALLAAVPRLAPLSNGVCGPLLGAAVEADGAADEIPR